jgi:uncharacterized protein YjcR
MPEELPKAARRARRKAPARTSDLASEIEAVRKLIRDAQELAAQDVSLDTVLSTLNTISRASASLANLLKAQRDLCATETTADYIRAALEEIRLDTEEKGVDSVLISGLS